MPTFKKGDRVVITDDHLANLGVYKGTHGTVIQENGLQPEVRWDRADGNREWWVEEDGSIKLVKSNEEQATPKLVFTSTPRGYGKSVFNELYREYYGADFGSDDKEVNNKKENPMSLSTKLRKLTLNASDRLLQDQGIVTETGELTGEGEEFVTQVLFEENKALIVEKLKAIVAAEEKKAKK